MVVIPIGVTIPNRIIMIIIYSSNSYQLLLVLAVSFFIKLEAYPI